MESGNEEVFHDDFDDKMAVSNHDLLILDENSTYYLKDHPTKFKKKHNTKKGIWDFLRSEVMQTKSVL